NLPIVLRSGSKFETGIPAALQHDARAKPAEQRGHLSRIVHGMGSDHDLNISEFASRDSLCEFQRTVMFFEKVWRTQRVDDDRELGVEPLLRAELFARASKGILKENVELRSAHNVHR